MEGCPPGHGCAHSTVQGAGEPPPLWVPLEAGAFEGKNKKSTYIPPPKKNPKHKKKPQKTQSPALHSCSCGASVVWCQMRKRPFVQQFHTVCSTDGDNFVLGSFS